MSRFRIENPQQLPEIPFGPDRGQALEPRRLEIADIRRRFEAPPDWAPESLDDRPIDPAMGDPRRAAVLIPLVARAHGTAVLLTRRSDTLRHHSGQIAFPGGRLDPGETAMHAALRETDEEIGLPASRVDIIGSLPGMRTGTGFDVIPFVAEIARDVEVRLLRPAPGEVDEIFEVPLAFLMDPDKHQRRIIRWHEGDQVSSRSFVAMPWRPDPDGSDEYFIWGVTASILRNFYRFLAA